MREHIDRTGFQEALDALITGDASTALAWFADDVVLTGTGGCFAGRAAGLAAVLERFADLSRATLGTFGTEVEAVHAVGAARFVVSTRHWARVAGADVRASQIIVADTDGQRINAMDTLSAAGQPSGLWD